MPKCSFVIVIILTGKLIFRTLMQILNSAQHIQHTFIADTVTVFDDEWNGLGWNDDDLRLIRTPIHNEHNGTIQHISFTPKIMMMTGPHNDDTHCSLTDVHTYISNR